MADMPVRRTGSTGLGRPPRRADTFLTSKRTLYGRTLSAFGKAGSLETRVMQKGSASRIRVAETMSPSRGGTLVVRRTPGRSAKQEWK